MPLEAPAAAEPPPAAQAGEPPLADPTSAEPRLATAEVPPAPAIPPETPPPLPEAQVDAEPPAPPPPALLPPALLPELPKARKAEDAVLARPPLPRLKPKPKPKSVAHPPKTPVDRDAAEREVAQQERREARREAAWQRATDRRAAAAAAAPAREPAEAQPRASAGEVASWRGALVAHLNRFKRSPPGGASGTARVSFSVTASGGVSGVRLASSSGDPALDEAALTMVQRADPVPAPPSGMGGRVSLSVPVHFSGP